MASKLKPWYQTVTPREDLRENRPLDASEFAVHLDHIRDKTAPDVYVRPDRFFERTYLTKSLLDLSAQVVRRLSGIKVETSAVFNMATQFGGGKTHALTALYHLSTGGSAAGKWRGVDQILLRAQVDVAPRADVAVFVGTEFDAVTGRGGDGESKRRTPWGEVAWQLGKDKAFQIVSEHDAKGIAPGGDVISKMIGDGPALILMDELMNYVSRARKSGLGAQTQLFLQNLTGVAAAAKNIVLCVSMPSSSETELPDAEDRTEYEALKKMLDRVGKAVAMSNEGEVTEIIRRRLFDWGGLGDDAKRTISAYAEWSRDHASELANLTAENAADLFRNSYPFHPSVISVFERKWQSLPRFQRTRGVLRLLALWVSKAYEEDHRKATGDPLIQLGSAPLHDPIFCDAVFEQLGEDKLRVPVNTDITGKPDSHALRLDNEATDSVKKARLHQKVATSIFFESNGGQSQNRAEATVPEIKAALGCPDFNLAEVETTLEGLSATCFYLVWERNRYRFGLRPNLNQMLVTSRGSVKQKDIDGRLKEEVEKLFKDAARAPSSGIDRRYFPKRSNDVPDRAQLTLIVLGVDHSSSDTATSRLIEEIVRNAGGAGRTFKSGLLFAVADSSAAVSQAAQTLIAWEDIDADDQSKARLDDNQRKELDKSLKRAARDLEEALFRAYRHVFLLDKTNSVRDIDLGQITSSSVNGGRIADLIVQELGKLDEISDGVGPNKLVRFWPPAMTDWSTKDVRDAFFSSPALPRLINPDSIKRTIADGVSQGILGYARRKPGGRPELICRPNEALAEQSIEIGEDVCILRSEDAQRLLEPPKLAMLRVAPDLASVRIREKVSFSVSGADQYGQPFPISSSSWEATGGTIDEKGQFSAGGEPGLFLVKARFGEFEGSTQVRIGAAPKDDSTDDKGGGSRQMVFRWTGSIPPQKWMNFYTKIVSKHVANPGLRLNVTIEVPMDDREGAHREQEARAALREIGLGDDTKLDQAGPP